MFLSENREATIASFEAKLNDLMSKPGMGSVQLYMFDVEFKVFILGLCSG